MGSTKIEWTDATWNPVVGCSKASPGCDHCYAETMARRLRAMGRPEYQEAHDGTGWTGGAVCLPERLEEPLRWRKPRSVFVCSMGDLFHPSVPFGFVAVVFGVMAASPWHTFQVLTKRPERMAEFLAWVAAGGEGALARHELNPRTIRGREDRKGTGFQEPPPPSPVALNLCEHLTRHIPDARRYIWRPWPLPNVWLGTTCEDQQRADERIPYLLQCPAAVRFVSVEPMLGTVDFRLLMPDSPEGGWPFGFDALRGRRLPDGVRTQKLDWVICGGETGPGARPMHPDWARSLRDQCVSAGVPFFFKQWGAWHPIQWSCCMDHEKGRVTLGEDGRYPWRDLHCWEDGSQYDMARMMPYDYGSREDYAHESRLLDGRTWEEMPHAR